MKSPLFIGSATALITPFRDGAIDYDATAALIDRQAAGGTAALVICGTTGEAATLSPAERDALIGFSTAHAAGRMKVIAGVGSNNTEAALSAAKRAEAAGVDGVMLVTPYYNKANRPGLIRHFTHVADGVGVPLIAYNVPSRTGVSCTAEVYEALAAHPNINGVKEASGDLSLASRTISRCGDALHIWSGNDDQTLPLMALGAKGVISVASNVIPGEMAALCRACLAGELAAARALQRQYAALFDKLFLEVNPIPVKAALRLMGLDTGELRLPLFALSPEPLSALEDCLRGLSLIA